MKTKRGTCIDARARPARAARRSHHARRHSDNAAAIARALERWFKTSARDLPWRRSRSGYSALVAEAMLQQTQVSRVSERYEQFVNAFPDCRALARAPADRVLAMWQGLGYYRRARLLHQAARMIVRTFGGEVPRTAAQLATLPGIGRYTAGAIASIVFKQREPIVDGNAKRVLMRIHGRRVAPDSPASNAWSWREARRLVDAADDPGDFNEAMMELGALVCTPRTPRCADCPVRRWCVAHRRGEQSMIPAPKRAPRSGERHHHAVAVRRGTRILLERRPDHGMWAGMWQVPTIESDTSLKSQALRRRLALHIGPMQRLGDFMHHTTHRHITFHVYEASANGLRRGTWRRVDDTADLAMSAAQRRILAMLRDTTTA